VPFVLERRTTSAICGCIVRNSGKSIGFELRLQGRGTAAAGQNERNAERRAKECDPNLVGPSP
jgi:hypothetical protein